MTIRMLEKNNNKENKNKNVIQLIKSSVLTFPFKMSSYLNNIYKTFLHTHTAHIHMFYNTNTLMHSIMNLKTTGI